MAKKRKGIVRLIPYRNDVFPSEEDDDEDNPLRFPDGIMSGFAGKFAEVYSDILEPPPHAFYMSALTCLGSVLSGNIRVTSELKADPRLYTLILGDSGTPRKSTSNMKTINFFRDTVPGFKISDGAGSAEGLQDALTESRWNNRLLLHYDEFRHFINKCKIESSVLLSCVNTLFESNRYSNRTKTKGISLEDAHLCLLSASTVDTYNQCWEDSFTHIGFNNRLFIVPSRGKRKYELPPPVKADDYEMLQGKLGEIIDATKNGVEYGIEPYARSYYATWYKGLEVSKYSTRLDTYAMRFMSLLAANDGRDAVDMETMVRVCKLCDWQLTVRKHFTNPEGDNPRAKMENAIKQALKNLASREVPVFPTESMLRRYANADRHGLDVFNRAMENLRKVKIIMKDENGKFRFNYEVEEEEQAEK